MLCGPIYTKLGMFARDLFKAACSYFGFEFKSSIFAPGSPYYNTTIMPEKHAWPNPSNNTLGFNFFETVLSEVGISTTLQNKAIYDEVTNLNNNLGFPFIGAYGYFDGTLQSFIKAMEDVFNARTKIIRNLITGKVEMHFERFDAIYNLSTYVLPNISDQAPFPLASSTNAREISANYELAFQTDLADENTLFNYLGSSCYCTTTPKLPAQKYNIVLEGLTEKQLIFAHATRKQKPSDVENFIQPVFDFINTLADIFSTSAQANTAHFSSSGQMYLSNHITTVPKIFIAGQPKTVHKDPTGVFERGNSSGVTVSQNNREGLGFLTAKSLMRDFHYSNFGLTKVPNNLVGLNVSSPYSAGSEYTNQYRILKNQKIPLCCEDFNKIKNNNTIKTFSGEWARVESLSWNLFTGVANITYRVREKYTSNLMTSYIIDGTSAAKLL
jgi:hypothetical protein